MKKVEDHLLLQVPHTAKTVLGSCDSPKISVSPSSEWLQACYFGEPQHNGPPNRTPSSIENGPPLGRPLSHTIIVA
jgi:hypothetical protein